jgi:hypothetical protein
MTPADIQAASQVVRRGIEQIEGPLPPAFVVEFLLRHWRAYLARTHAKYGGGGESPEWARALAATDRLLWSIAPKPTPEDRAKLLRTLKELLPQLKHGMAVALMSEQAQSAFLHELSDFHSALVNPKATPTAEAKAAAEQDPASTLRMDVHDPRYRAIMDLLRSDNVEQIDM